MTRRRGLSRMATATVISALAVIASLRLQLQQLSGWIQLAADGHLVFTKLIQ